MLQDEIKLMLLSVIEDRKKLSKLYKEGYFKYYDNKDYKGSIAVVNNKAVISFLEDINNESKMVATANFKNSGTLIYKLFDKNYSFSRIGKDPFISNYGGRQIHMRDKNQIIEDISSIRKYCAEAEERSTAIQKESYILNKFNRIQNYSNSEISKEEVLSLLEDTVDKLDKTRYLAEKESELEK